MLEKKRGRRENIPRFLPRYLNRPTLNGRPKRTQLLSTQTALAEFDAKSLGFIHATKVSASAYHPADRIPVPDHRLPIHPRGNPLPRQRRGEIGSVNTSVCLRCPYSAYDALYPPVLAALSTWLRKSSISAKTSVWTVKTSSESSSRYSPCAIWFRASTSRSSISSIFVS